MSSKPDEFSPFIAFARQHGKSVNSYFTASVAMGRCQALLSDLDDLEAATKDAGLRYFGFEIISYYGVGFVTCLEWHGRSRLSDTISFDPNTIEAAHVKKLSSDLLAQAMRTNATVSHVIGAMTNISNLDEYSEIFNKRVFPTLNITTDPRRLAAEVTLEMKVSAGLEPDIDLGATLSELFTLRHRLVHEIDQAFAGPYPLRENLGFGHARQFGRATLLIMQLIEKEISRCAPDNFPHLLDDRFYPVHQVETLAKRVRALEDQVDAVLKSKQPVPSYELWKEAQRATAVRTEKWTQFIDGADLGPIRYFNPRDKLVVLVLQQRIAYLTELLREVF